MKNRILQFGEGVFLRCFADWMVQRMNDRAGFDGAVQIIQPRHAELREASAALNAAGGRYRVILRGLSGGRSVETAEDITCVRGVDVAANLGRYAADPDLRFVISNTTEAGIQHMKGADTFPAKVLRLLKLRHAAGLPGLVFLPCELIERNGDELKRCVLAHAADEGAEELASWIARECVFCSTLVDRIVAGREGADVVGEPFHFLAVQPPPGYDLEAELPLRRAGLNVTYADDLQPYRTRKVRFLNAVHTTMACLGMERGFAEVAECVADPAFNAFLRKLIFDEIFQTVDLPVAEKREFAESVLERFANPFAHHKLASIALNTVAKWKVRCLPVVCDYAAKFGRLPENMMAGYDAIARRYDNLTA